MKGFDGWMGGWVSEWGYAWALIGMLMGLVIRNRKGMLERYCF